MGLAALLLHHWTCQVPSMYGREQQGRSCRRSYRWTLQKGLASLVTQQRGRRCRHQVPPPLLLVAGLAVGMLQRQVA